MPPSNHHLHAGLIMNAWALYRAQLWRWVGIGALAYGGPLALFFVARALLPPGGEPSWQHTLLWIGFWIVLFSIERFFEVGMCRLTLDQLNGEPLRLRRLFTPEAGFWATVGTALLTGLAVGIGYGAGYVPGLVLEGLFLLVSPVLAARRIRPVAAIQLSVKTLQPEWVYAALFAMTLNTVRGGAGGFLGPIGLITMVFLAPLVAQVLALLYQSYFSYRSFEYRG